MRSAFAITALTALLASPAGAFMNRDGIGAIMGAFGAASAVGLKDAVPMPNAPPSDCPDAFGNPPTPFTLCEDGLDEWHRNYFNREDDQ